jgi:hypothetical protein
MKNLIIRCRTMTNRSWMVLGWPRPRSIVFTSGSATSALHLGPTPRALHQSAFATHEGISVYRYLTLALVLLEYSAVAQECPAPHPATPGIIHVPHEEYFIASLKSRLIRLLTDSLIDEGRGLVDIARERQIQKLMKQIKEESGYAPHNPQGKEGDAQRARTGSSLPTDMRKAPNSQTEMVTTTDR